MSGRVWLIITITRFTTQFTFTGRVSGLSSSGLHPTVPRPYQCNSLQVITISYMIFIWCINTNGVTHWEGFKFHGVINNTCWYHTWRYTNTKTMTVNTLMTRCKHRMPTPEQDVQRMGWRGGGGLPIWENYQTNLICIEWWGSEDRQLTFENICI